jgi:hypothetical protein
MFPYGARAANEDEERSLEGVLRGVIIAQDRLANAKHHRTMALSQRRERQLGCFTAAGRKSAQQFAVRQPTNHTNIEEGAKVPAPRSISTHHHRSSPPKVCVTFGSAARIIAGSDFLVEFREETSEGKARALQRDIYRLSLWSFFGNEPRLQCLSLSSNYRQRVDANDQSAGLVTRCDRT